MIKWPSSGSLEVIVLLIGNLIVFGFVFLLDVGDLLLADPCVLLVLVGAHHSVVGAHDLVLVNCNGQFLDPVFGSQLEDESGKQDGESPGDAAEELLGSEFSRVEKEEKPVVSAPLNSVDDHQHNDVDPTVEELAENVEIARAHNAAVNFVEVLQEHEHIEDNGQVLLLGEGACSELAILGVGGLFVVFVLEVEQVRAEANDNHHHNHVPRRDAVDLAPDHALQDLSLSSDSSLIDYGGKGSSSGKSDSSESVHNEVDPEQLDAVQG